jgi:hypothetical protein
MRSSRQASSRRSPRARSVVGARRRPERTLDRADLERALADYRAMLAEVRASLASRGSLPRRRCPLCQPERFFPRFGGRAACAGAIGRRNAPETGARVAGSRTGVIPSSHMKLALGPRGMKLSLIKAAAIGAVGVSLITGCAGSAQSVAPSTPVGTTSLTGAAMTPAMTPSTSSTPSTLAPAAWEADETSAAGAPAPLPTWGTAVAVTPTAN